MDENIDDYARQGQSSDMDASTSQGKAHKRRGRGPSRAVQSSTPMFLEFDEFDMPTGQWESAYGRQIGSCAQRIDINLKGYPKLDPVQKQGLWEETKVI